MSRTRRSILIRTILATALVAALAVSSLSASVAAPRRHDLDAAQQRLQELEADFQGVVEKYNVVHERLDSIRADIAAAELEIHRLQGRMSAKEKDAIEVAVRLYKSGTAQPMQAVLSSDSLAELNAQLGYLSATEEAQAAVFEQLEAYQHELDEKVARLEEDRARVAADEARLAELAGEIEAKLAEQKDEIAALGAAIERAQERREAARLSELEARREAARVAAVAAQQNARESGGANNAGGSSPAPAPSPGPAPAPSGGAAAAVDAALSQVGKPYRWGAAGPDAYDCSGLTMWSWAHGGVSLPHSSQMQYGATSRISSSAVQPGDLLFYGSPIHHVSMYIGNGQMVEAPYTGSQVRVVAAFPLRSDFVGAGRP